MTEKLTKGNYAPTKEAEVEGKKEETDKRKEWEKSVLAKLGGSTAFVREAKGKFVEG